tara:strand:+ start:380 stop:505 length:126 start_codon:yes stop_codon:yes gene_type:complete
MQKAQIKQLLAMIDPKIKNCFFLFLGLASTNTNLFELETVM